MIFELLIGACCVAVGVIFWKTRFSKESSPQPPDFSGKLPFIGHAHQFMCDSLGLLKVFNKISEECLERGGVIVVKIGFRKIYVSYFFVAISNPEDCLTLSNTCLEKEEIYKMGKPFLGNGLVVSDVPTWKKHRKLLNPAFSQSVLNTFVGTFNSQARILVDMFARNIGKPFNHEELLRINNLETICITSTGLDTDEHHDLQKQYMPLLSKVLSTISQRFARIWLHKNFIFNMSKLKKEQDKLLKSMFELTDTIIQVKKAEMFGNSKTAVIQKSGKPKPFFDLILELANETGCFTDEEIKEETDNIIAAGHDTSASVVTFALTLLGSHPNVQDKVYNEISKVFEDNKELDKDDLSKLVYTEAVIKETLRLFPIAPVVARCVDQVVKLKNYTLEPQSGCFLMISGLNRHPMWGPDVNQFRPERWLDADTLPDLHYFGVFGLGRRSCIGKVYAMMSMKIVVAHVVRQYKITADVTKMILKWDVLTRPVSGHEITIKLRRDSDN